ncbi:MAG: alpha/beta fold hydrolase [Candidatus Nanohalobium sp.]
MVIDRETLKSVESSLTINHRSENKGLLNKEIKGFHSHGFPAMHPVTRVGEENMHLRDSEKDSRLQLIFVPGIFSPEAWKYQMNYFSEDYRAISFWPTLSNRDLEGHRKALKNILDQKDVDNAVLIGANFTNPVIQGFEAREDVAGTVLVGAKRKLKKGVPKEVYQALTSKKFPVKLSKKLFFSSMRYREVRNFCRDTEFIGFDDFKTFQKRFGVRQPEKEALIVHGKNDFFSDEGYARELMSSASVSVLDAGIFSFYEKPQEFNKTLNDFLLKIKRKAVQERIEETKERNRTLEEFEKKLAKVKN